MCKQRELVPILARLLQGDEQAGRILLDAVHPRLYASAKKRVFSSDEADRMCREVWHTFGIKFRSFDFRTDGQLWAWFFRCLHYHILRLWRERGGQSPPESTGNDDPDVEDAGPKGSIPSGWIEPATEDELPQDEYTRMLIAPFDGSLQKLGIDVAAAERRRRNPHRERLIPAIAKLSKMQHQCIVLNKWLDYSGAKIASALEITPESVKNHLQAARQRLRTILQSPK